MRAAIDTILLAAWAALGFCAILWFISTAIPESELLGNHGELLGRLLVTGFPLISAWRVQHNYQVAYAKLWAAGLWLFSLLFLVSYMQQKTALLQTTLILASLLFIALPVPTLHVRTEMRKAWTRIKG